MPEEHPVEVEDRAARWCEPEGGPRSPTWACVAVNRQLGIARESIHRWVGRDPVDANDRPAAESEEIDDCADPGGRPVLQHRRRKPLGRPLCRDHGYSVASTR